MKFSAAPTRVTVRLTCRGKLANTIIPIIIIYPITEVTMLKMRRYFILYQVEASWCFAY